MRILIVSTFFPPLNSIASLRPYAWAKYWSEAGHEVTVLTTNKEKCSASLPYSLSGFELVEVPIPRLFSRLKQSQFQPSSEVSQTMARSFFSKCISILRFKKGVFNAARMPDFTDVWAFSAYKMIAKEGRWDVVISTAGPYTVHFVGYWLKKAGLCSRWVADYRDTWSNNYIYPGLFPFNAIERRLEKKMLQKADLVTTVSDPFAASFRLQFAVPNVSTIENGFDPADLAAIDSTPCFPDDGKVRLVHTGSIYLGKRDPSPLFLAIQKMAANKETAHWLQKLEVLFVGPRQANLEELIDQHAVGQWVRLWGFVGREEALAMQRDAHALLFLAWNDPAVDGVLTGKIFEYLYSKTPIMAVGSTQLEAAQQLILEANAGVALTSVEEIEAYLTSLLKKGEKMPLFVNQDFLDRYNRKTLSLKLLTLMQNQ